MTASKAAAIITATIGHWTSVPDARSKLTAAYNDGIISRTEHNAAIDALDTIG